MTASVSCLFLTAYDLRNTSEDALDPMGLDQTAEHRAGQLVHFVRVNPDCTYRYRVCPISRSPSWKLLLCALQDGVPMRRIGLNRR